MTYYWVIIDFSKEPIEITKLTNTKGKFIIYDNGKVSLKEYKK